MCLLAGYVRIDASFPIHIRTHVHTQVGNTNTKGLAGAKKLWDHMFSATINQCAHVARGEVCACVCV